jgi:hypothetical protein
MDNFQSSSRRTDEQLEAILNDVARWVVNGRQGQPLCTAASLRHAIDRAHLLATSGAVVIAICRLPNDNVIVFSEQIKRLQRMISVREMVAA